MGDVMIKFSYIIVFERMSFVLFWVCRDCKFGEILIFWEK